MPLALKNQGELLLQLACPEAVESGTRVDAGCPEWI